MSKRITAHQRAVYDRIVRLSRETRRWVASDFIGSRGACEHLVAKGYLARREVVGPRGGITYEYRPL
jgi:hypothetical protein